MGTDPADIASIEDDTADEVPEHDVCITQPFWIGQYEVTNAEYQQFVDADGYTTREYWSDAGWGWRRTRTQPVDHLGSSWEPNHPRVGITFYEAEAFAAWAGGRLPTEAEWEYAAKGAYTTTMYPWGKEYVLGYANVDESYIDGEYLGHVAPVGSYPNNLSWANAYDMAGNVWKWCADWYQDDYYELYILNDPHGPASGIQRILRGGSWSTIPVKGRTANRTYAYPDVEHDIYGVRIVIDAAAVS
jgi:iron(II)-dependent oxidoreductase